MDYIKIFIISVFITSGFSFILYRLAGFESGAAIFIGTGTVILSYIMPQLLKMHKERKTGREKL